MIYVFLRFLSRLAVWLNFRKVYVEHAERIPRGKHLIYGQNHPTAFLDPIILGTHIPEKAWFMLRGDKFVNEPVRWFLRKIHNLPIWRQSEGGRSALRSNLETMAFATDRIVAGEPTVILSEGVCRHERRLRPIQRGTARMLFQAQRKAADERVAIVPVATNYTASNGFRSSVALTFGEPIYAHDYAKLHRADPRAAVEAVTAELQKRLRAEVIHVADRSRDRLVDRLLPLIQHARPDTGVRPVARRSPYRREQWLAVEAVNALDPVDARTLESELDDYYAALERHGLTDSGVALPAYASVGRAFALWIFGPLILLGWLMHYPLATIIQRRTERLVRNPQFYSSVRWGLGLGAFIVSALLLATLVGLALGWVAAVFVPPFMYVLAYGFLVHRDAYTLWQQAARTRSVTPETLAELRRDRAAILARVGFLGE